MRTASTRFDLFDEAPGDRQTPRPAPRKRGSDAAPQPSNWTDEEAARRLEASGQYRILRRLVPRPILPQRQSLLPHVAVLVDVETTGLHHSRDEVIEIGAVAFTYDCDGGIGAVVGVYSGLRQPSVPFPTEITRLTAARTRWSRVRTSTLLPATRSSSPRTSSSPTMRGLTARFARNCHRPSCRRPGRPPSRKSDGPTRASRATSSAISSASPGCSTKAIARRTIATGFSKCCRGRQAKREHAPFSELLASARSRVRIFAENSPFDMKAPEGEGLSTVGRERRAAEGLVDRDR